MYGIICKPQNPPQARVKRACSGQSLHVVLAILVSFQNMCIPIPVEKQAQKASQLSESEVSKLFFKENLNLPAFF